MVETGFPGQAGQLNLLRDTLWVTLRDVAPVNEVEIHEGKLHLSPRPPHMHTQASIHTCVHNLERKREKTLENLVI